MNSPPPGAPPNENALLLDAKRQEWISIAQGRTEPAGFGSAITFAARMTARRKGKIGIIKLSRGDCNLARDWLGEGENSPYEHLREMQPAAGKTHPIKIVGMLCIQGGADAKNEEMATA